MDNKHQEEQIAYALIFGLLVAFSVFVLKQYFYVSEKPLDLITAAIYFWTGVILTVYTYETYQLRKEAQRQTELQLRPFVILHVEHVAELGGSYKAYQTHVENLGNGVAINISVRQVEESSTQWAFDFPESVPILIAKQRLPINCHPGRRDDVGGEPRVVFAPLRELYYQDTKEHVVLRIEFKNIEGRGYAVIQSISRDDLRFAFA
jgi:hypothetical protein